MTNSTISEAPPIKLIESALNAEPQNTEPLYELVRAELEGLIDKHFEDGQRFWTESVLSEHLNVSRITIRRALKELSLEGRLCRYRARGTFVRKPAPTSITKRLPAMQNEIALRPGFIVNVLAPRYESAFYLQIIDHLVRECDSRGTKLRLYYVEKGDSGADAMHQVGLSDEHQAFILLGNDLQSTRSLYRTLSTRGHRTVSIDTLLPDERSAYVGTNGELGTHLGMQHLVDLGHRRIAFLVCEPDRLLNIKSRMKAFRDFVGGKDLQDAFLVNLHNDGALDPFALTYDYMDELWKSQPTAIFSVSDAGAWAAIKWLRERGYGIPEEISVIGFDDLRPSQLINPPLTSVAQPYRDLVLRALDMIERGEQSVALLPPGLSIRQSSGPVPRSF